MSDHVAGNQPTGPAPFPGLRDATREITGYWWLQLLAGIAWVFVSLVILQFDSASITTVGVLVGLMFVLSAAQNFALARSMSGGTRWVAAIFGGLFVVAAGICFASPQDTFAALADSLGFLFLIVGVWWMTRAFLERAVNPLWWLGLISGILMSIVAFWTSGQFFIHRAYVLLVFAGIWALMQGTTDIVRAFATRRLHEEV
jgi:uncharacterized membrane protein HdeD (DUF308 family)